MLCQRYVCIVCIVCLCALCAHVLVCAEFGHLEAVGASAGLRQQRANPVRVKANSHLKHAFGAASEDKHTEAQSVSTRQGQTAKHAAKQTNISMVIVVT